MGVGTREPGCDLTFNLEFQRDEESGWFVAHVVELPGCVSQGATIEEAKANIANALEAYIGVLLETAIRNQAVSGISLSIESNVSETSGQQKGLAKCHDD